MGNAVLNIFSCNNFFEKSNIFLKTKKNCFGGGDVNFFWKKELSYVKSEYYFCITNLFIYLFTDCINSYILINIDIVY